MSARRSSPALAQREPRVPSAQPAGSARSSARRDPLGDRHSDHRRRPPLGRDDRGTTVEARLAGGHRDAPGGFTDLLATAIANAESRSELAASRVRVVTAADETRRRIERDLHDGAQQRLVTLGLELRAAQKTVPPELGALRASCPASLTASWA